MVQALVVKFLRRFRILLQLLWNVHGSRSIWKPSINLALHFLVFDTSTTGLVLPLKKQSFTLDFSRCVTWIFTVTQLNLRSLMMTYFGVFLLMCIKELFNIDNLTCANSRLCISGIGPSQNEWTKKPGPSNSKIHPPTGSLISASLFTLANLYVQKGFAQQDVFSALRA